MWIFDSVHLYLINCGCIASCENRKTDLSGIDINFENFTYRAFVIIFLDIFFKHLNTKTNCTYLFADFRMVTIISDSMAKNVTGIFGTILQIFSGKAISQVAKQKASYENYSFINSA